MTDEDIKRMAEAAELSSEQDWYGQKIMAAMWNEDVDLLPYLRRFASAVQAEERERCKTLIENANSIIGGTARMELAALICKEA